VEAKVGPFIKLLKKSIKTDVDHADVLSRSLPVFERKELVPAGKVEQLDSQRIDRSQSRPRLCI
jgi:hypothetical protein